MCKTKDTPTPETLLAVACRVSNMPEYHPTYFLSRINQLIGESNLAKVKDYRVVSAGDCIRVSKAELEFDGLEYYVIVCPTKALTIGAIEGLEEKAVTPMTDYNIPERIKRGIDNYGKNGVPTGGFLKAVLCNDLFEAVGRAVQDSKAALHEILRYIYNEIPYACWGSLEKYKAWIESHAAKKAVTP